MHDRLVRECRAVARTGWFEVTISSIVLSLMAFGVGHWSSEDLDDACEVARAMLVRMFRTS